MKNVLHLLDSKLVLDYKITEAFILNNELYLTSEFDISYETFNRLENELTN